MFDVLEFRKEFPILSKRVNDKPLVYFDNGASSQKPIKVIEAVKKRYESGIPMFIEGYTIYQSRDRKIRSSKRQGCHFPRSFLSRGNYFYIGLY